MSHDPELERAKAEAEKMLEQAESQHKEVERLSQEFYKTGIHTVDQWSALFIAAMSPKVERIRRLNRGH